MPKRPISLTLEEGNLLWLRGRTAAAGFRSVSETLDRLVTEARTSGKLEDLSVRSVVGTIDIAASDALLEGADVVLGKQFEASLRRPLTPEKRRGAGRRSSTGKTTRRRRG